MSLRLSHSLSAVLAIGVLVGCSSSSDTRPSSLVCGQELAAFETRVHGYGGNCSSLPFEATVSATGEQLKTICYTEPPCICVLDETPSEGAMLSLAVKIEGTEPATVPFEYHDTVSCEEWGETQLIEFNVPDSGAGGQGGAANQ